MKKLLFSAASLIALLTFSCNDSGSDGKMPSDATPADSLAYYQGIMDAQQFKAIAQRDTILSTPEGKAAFLEGVKAGLGLPKDEDEAYNQGTQLGYTMKVNFIQFQKMYGQQINPSVYINSLTAAINNDSTLNVAEAQKEAQKVVDGIRDRKIAEEKKIASESLATDAKSKNLPKINNDLYGKVTSSNDSAKLKEGDLVNLQIKAVGASGEPVPAAVPNRGKIGARNMPEVLNDALKTMRTGETGEFMTTAVGLFPERYAQFGLEGKDKIILTITPTLVPTKEEPTKDDEK